MKRSLPLLLSIGGLFYFGACGGGSGGNSVGGGGGNTGGGGGGNMLPTVTISASSNSITIGQQVTLTWSSTNSTSCTASATPSENDWSGAEPTSGSQSVKPAASGTVIYTLMCAGAAGSAPGSVSVTANSISPLMITSGPLSNGQVGSAYGQPHSVKSVQGPTLKANFFQLTASGGTGAISWNWAAAQSSSLPPGLDCCVFIFGTEFPPIHAVVRDAIHGVPTEPGTFHVVITVTDSASPPTQASATYAIMIAPPPPPVINATSPAIGTLNSPYVGFTFTASEGLPPLTWSETGALPTGMQFSSIGVLSGTPTQAGSFPITVRAQDSANQNSAPQGFTIQVLAKGFVPTGNMESSREGHTATLLKTGKVLVAGGDSTGIPGLPATAELFDPTSGTFSATGSMGTARVSHTATLLADGRVLVTGGTDDTDNPTSSAEIFDPTKGTFSPTGSMEIGRLFNTATLLNTGKVLVAGGLEASGGFLTTAELFDPTTGMFTPTGRMATARAGHTATLLSDGKVLVAGGDTPTAEIYDPSTETFTPTGSLEAARVDHTATLLKSGKVLLTGGQDNGSAPLNSTEIFDPTSGTFTPTGNMENVRSNHTAVLLNDGTVLVAGGINASTGLSFSSAELFDPTTGTFSPTADMTTQRQSHTATLLNNGEVLVTGGQNTQGNLATAELYQ